MWDVVVVGAGLGGLSAAAVLARRGLRVAVFEKNDQVGGRCGRLALGGCRLDTGPTLVLMPGLIAEALAAADPSAFGRLDLRRVEPAYRLFFPDGFSLTLGSDLAGLKPQLETLEPGSFGRLLEFLGRAHRFYRVAVDKFIRRNFLSFLEYFGPQNWAAFLEVGLLFNHYRWVGRFFKDPRLRAAFTFQDVYLGMSPFAAPATYALLTAAEITEGLWFPPGGVYRLVEVLVDLCRRLGVALFPGCPVERIPVDGRRVVGVVLEGGKAIPARAVVANADLPYIYSTLLPPGAETKRLLRLDYSCSVVAFYWRLEGGLEDLGPHNVFFGPEYQTAFDQVFRQRRLPDAPSFYVHLPARIDPGLAAGGAEPAMVLVPTGRLDGGPRDLTAEAHRARRAVLDRLGRRVEERIRDEVVRTPADWQRLYNLTFGAAFGLGHRPAQMGYLRPSNRHPRYPNLYFAGASTHPGTGVPLTLLSGRLAAERLLSDFKFGSDR